MIYNQLLFLKYLNNLKKYYGDLHIKLIQIEQKFSEIKRWCFCKNKLFTFKKIDAILLILNLITIFRQILKENGMPYQNQEKL